MQFSFIIPSRRLHFRAVLGGKRTRANQPTPCNARVFRFVLNAIRAYLRNPGPTKWCGHQDCLQYAGPLRCRLHPAYLHPRYPADAGSSSGNHGQLHDPDDVAHSEMQPKTPGRKAKLPAQCSLTLSAHFPVWVKLWVPDPLFDPFYFHPKQNKNSRNPAISGVSWSCYPDLNWTSNTVNAISQSYPQSGK